MNKLLAALLTGFIVSAANAQITVLPAAPPVVAGSTTVTTTTKDIRTGTVDGTRVGNTATTTTRTTRSTTVANDARVMGAPATVTTVHRDIRVRKPCPPGLAKKNNGCVPPGLARKMPRD